MQFISPFILGIRAYEQLGFRAFGNAGKIIAACIITIHNIGGEINGTVWNCQPSYPAMRIYSSDTFTHFTRWCCSSFSLLPYSHVQLPLYCEDGVAGCYNRLIG